MNRTPPRAYSRGSDPSKGVANSASDPLEERRIGDAEDLRWVRQHLAGDAAGFENLYHKHRERIFAVLMRTLRQREDALEATQEVFLKIHKRLGTFDPKRPFLPWATRIAANQAIDQLRRRRVRKEQTLIEETVDSDGKSGRQEERGEDSLIRSEVGAAVQAALGQLNEDHRTVFVLSSFEEMSYKEIATVLGIPVGTVMSRLYNARRKIRALLPDEWDPGGPARRRDKDRE